MIKGKVNDCTYEVVQLFILHYLGLQLNIGGMFLADLFSCVVLAPLVLVSHQLHFSKTTLAQGCLWVEIGGI